MKTSYRFPVAGMIAAILAGAAAAQAAPAANGRAPQHARLEGSTQIKSSVHEGSFAGLGEVRVRADEVGEPVSQPLRIQVEISCGSDEQFRIALHDERACRYDGISWDRAKGVLLLKVGQYDPDRARCGGSREVPIRTESLCK